MYIKGTFVLALFFAVIMALTSNTNVEARSIEASQESDVPQETKSPLIRRKRRAFHYSCKGIYDKELYARLDRACMDCQNLYRREPSVEGKCRHNCFGTDVFRSCIKDLQLPVKTYLEIAYLLREG